MGNDNVVELFGDLQEPGSQKAYPGKRPPVVHSSPKPTVSDTPEWYEKPQTHLFNGEPRHMYPISRVAQAFGRSVQTIRGWETNGSLPPTRYRTQAGQYSLPGTKPRGRRLWTRDQIEGMLRIASEEKCITCGGPDKNPNIGPPPTARFTDRVIDLFIALAEAEDSK